MQTHKAPVNQPVIIKALLKKHNLGKVRAQPSELDHYPVGEKCNAIINWARQRTSFEFDLDFVKSVHSKYSDTGRVTFKQEEGLNNIISQFGIEVTTWS